MFRFFAIAAIALGFTGVARAAGPTDYKGPFPTSALYELCSRSDQASRAKCEMYLKGMMSGIRMQKGAAGDEASAYALGLMAGVRLQKQNTDRGLSVCLPDELPSDKARAMVTEFIDQTTGGKPSNNKDGGDWVAFVALAEGNICKK